MTSYARNYRIIWDQIHKSADVLEFSADIESPEETTLTLVRSYTSQNTVHNVRRRRQG